MAGPGYKDNLKTVGKALDKLLSLKTMNEFASGRKGSNRDVDGYCAGVIRALVSSAQDGNGPGDSQYAAYSASYNKQIAKAGQAGSKRWLRGLGNTGIKGGMLGRGRFATTVDGSGKLWLVWTSDGSKEMDIYWKVHQDGGPKCPARPWFHLNTVATTNALIQALNLAVEDAVAEFNAKRMRT